MRVGCLDRNFRETGQAARSRLAKPESKTGTLHGLGCRVSGSKGFRV